MQWTLSQKGIRAVLIRMLFLILVWLMVAFVFATEFYLSARNDPIKIPWTVAVGSAFRDWFPWILLSPLAVILAGRFRFDRNAWRRSLAIHFVACVLFAFAYQGLLMLAYPTGFFLSAGGAVGITTSVPGAIPPLPGGIGIAGARSFSLQPNSNLVMIGRGGVFEDAAPPPNQGNVDTLFFTETNRAVAIEGHIGAGSPDFHVGFQTFRSVSRWGSFLRMAMLKTQFTVPIYLCIVCVCWVIGHFQESGERERRTLELEARLSQANLQALKMQLQPHFLFNTLNSISSLVHENPRAADEMIGSLSQFLRTTLEVSAQNEVPLRRELEFVDRYLEIQQTRFGDRLRVGREIDSKSLEALVPPLILQPLVENAIRYGIECRETGGTVIIRALREQEVLRLEICDNGDGSGGRILRSGNGIGLSNTKARLQELYGEKHELKITAVLPAGTCVKIAIPFRLPPNGIPNRT